VSEAQTAKKDELRGMEEWPPNRRQQTVVDSMLGRAIGWSQGSKRETGKGREKDLSRTAGSRGETLLLASAAQRNVAQLLMRALREVAHGKKSPVMLMFNPVVRTSFPKRRRCCGPSHSFPARASRRVVSCTNRWGWSAARLGMKLVCCMRCGLQS
jgi:hypothetical protein